MFHYFIHSKTILVLLSLIFTSVYVHADDFVIHDIHHEGIYQDSDIVKIKLSDLKAPKLFYLGGKKPRLVLDFYEFSYTSKQNRSFEINGKFIQRVRVGLHIKPDKKTRIVFDLRQDLQYTIVEELLTSENIFSVKISQNNEKLGAKATVKVEESNVEGVSDNNFAESSPAPAITLMERDDGERNSRIVKNESVNEKKKENNIKSVSQVPTVDESLKTEEITPQLLKVEFSSASNNKEKVLFTLNGFYPPKIAAKEEEGLQVLCEFSHMIIADELADMSVKGGKYIQSIEIKKGDDSKLSRVILKLDPLYNYDLKQLFFKEKNLYVVILESLGAKVEE